MRLQHLASLAFLAASIESILVLQANATADNVLVEGDVVALKWNWDGDSTGSGVLRLLDDEAGRIYTLEGVRPLNLASESYEWTVRLPTTVEGPVYHLLIDYNDGANSSTSVLLSIAAPASSSSTIKGGLIPDLGEMTTGITKGNDNDTRTTEPPTTSVTASPNATTTSPIASTSSNSSTSLGQDKPPSPGRGSSRPSLSGGTLAGIAIAAVAGAGAFAGLAGAAVYYRRQYLRGGKQQGTRAKPAGGDAPGDEARPGGLYSKAELALTGPAARYELDGTREPREVDAPSRPTELDSAARFELPGDDVTVNDTPRSGSSSG
ncbi:hypothetical protein SAMD00023353_8400160 [Rosellinia necatrix]|uniref:Uncharacterized protein n=1 Tax=Rosellinia necatrix TaxID=77044 RepID=A0A1W2TW86_ROSNE|nr:hypothetical protein SAMD00023353_8400160 [Rosellinia necatrix]